MAVKQLSVFVQNQKGALADVLNTLKDANIEIRALSIADTNDFGILRLITDNNDKASFALAENHFLSSVTEVVAACINNRPGGLAEIIEILSNNDINVEYLYAFVAQSKAHAYVVLRVADNTAAEQVLKAGGVELLSDSDI